jgi:hypothetical protein
MRIALTCLLLLMFSTSGPLIGDELLPAETPIEIAIDSYLEARLNAESVAPAPQAPDGNLLRRTMLDLVGRPPTMQEAQSYAADPAPDKRTSLVARLIGSPAYVRHQTTEFDALLMRGARESLRNYLRVAIAENRPWDRMFREMLLGVDGDPEQKQGGLTFVRARANDTDRLTTDVSSLFFGVNVSCAKCHDHPLVPDWKQDHYFGMKSFFDRTFQVGDFVGEKEYGVVKFKTVEGEERTAKLMFLTSDVLDEPEVRGDLSDEEKKEEKKRLEELKKSRQPPPSPQYSRRARLVEIALQPEKSAMFARAIANQLWNRFLGRGLVMPVDQLHSENPPSHPELLAWFARDLQTHGYDLQRLIRGIVLSKAYARSSRWESENRPADNLFAVAIVRPLTPSQYGTTLRLASCNPDEFPASLSPEELDGKIQSVETAGREITSGFEQPGDGFQVSVDEALLLSNSQKVANNLLRSGPDALLNRLQALNDSQAKAELAIWGTTARPPLAEEVSEIKQYLDARGDRPDSAVQQVLWSLLMSSELRFNY